MTRESAQRRSVEHGTIDAITTKHADGREETCRAPSLAILICQAVPPPVLSPATCSLFCRESAEVCKRLEALSAGAPANRRSCSPLRRICLRVERPSAELAPSAMSSSAFLYQKNGRFTTRSSVCSV